MVDSFRVRVRFQVIERKHKVLRGMRSNRLEYCDCPESFSKVPIDGNNVRRELDELRSVVGGEIDGDEDDKETAKKLPCPKIERPRDETFGSRKTSPSEYSLQASNTFILIKFIIDSR